MLAIICRKLWNYRSLIAISIITELRVRYARSYLSFAWMIMHPLAQVIIYSFVLSNILTARLPQVNNKHAYVFYILSGTLAWSFIQEVIVKTASVFIDNANLIKKIAFPKIILISTTVCIAIVNHLILLALSLLIFLLLGLDINWFLLQLFPFFLLILIASSLGFGLLVGVINVFLRGVGYTMPVFLQLVFWATPIVYPLDIIPAKLQWVIHINPIVPIVSLYQQVLLFGQVNIDTLTKSLIIAVCLLALGSFTYKRACNELVDAL
ncbi:MAG: hypothetical protein A3F18_06120 [Legionellales bacterium RIFCSPHIGHO2_12_FULL_37_14]|nr:MAG: hypothetical protein A3F18_06120 [Legionellales bacterium RIFCSPHIGHO2_12_FULL_37_14]